MLQETPDILGQPPLPGGVAAVARFFLQLPQGVQIFGGIAGVALLAILAAVCWRRRSRIFAWFGSRSAGLRIGLSAGAVLIVVTAVGFSRVSWDYMQHDNEFCTGCHVMTSAFQKFTESGHSELSCHDCHRQSIFASMRQLNMWVTNRPEEIGEHSAVSREVCSECHIQANGDSVWQRISQTAGHVVHLESDSAHMAELECVVCHGLEVHQFVPADQTCGQSDCHASESTEIVLGAMTGETGLHCSTCHEFTAEVFGAVRLDSTPGPLTPGQSQCFACHEMEDLWAEYDPNVDPHEARCGACHNPHEQEFPNLALATCAQADCHAGSDTLTPFHAGLPAEITENCVGCHQPHVWTRDGEDCAACHETGAGVHPISALTVAARFDHDDHPNVACAECHSNDEAHGATTISTPADCAACHHRESASKVSCSSCHTPQQLAGRHIPAARIKLSVWDSDRERSLPFAHAVHDQLECGSCHEGESLGAADNCSDCHDEHHRLETQCVSCHEEHRTDAHTAEVHVSGCGGSGCHEPAPYSTMGRTRSFCQACHQDQLEHEPGELCLNCHLVRSEEPRAQP